MGSGEARRTADYQTAHLHPEPFPVHTDEGCHSHCTWPSPDIHTPKRYTQVHTGFN